MRRRDLIACLAGAAALRPLTGLPQQRKEAMVGVLVAGRPDPEPAVRLFRQGLRERGWIEGQNLRVVVRSAAGKIGRLPELAAGLVREKPDIIVAWMTPAVFAAKRATSQIPIVMMGAGDPVGTGIVASLGRPGGNVTGMAGVTAELAGKLVELLKEVLPSVNKVAALCNAPDPFWKPFLKQIQLAGKAQSVDIVPMMVAAGAKLETAFPLMAAERIDAVIVQPSLPLKRAADLALRHHLPAVSPLTPFARAGGLMAYAATAADYYREAAVFVDKILRGAKPADLPIEQPTKFELVLNPKTAKALGVTVPRSFLARVDRVIQ